DIAIGAVVQSDYNFRGVSQSNKGPSAGAYFEPQFNTALGQIYVGLAGWSINWPGTSNFGFTDPSAEIDLYGGWRNTFGALSLDIGSIYYYYPKEQFNGFTKNSDFFEIYGKASYAVTYASLTGKWVTPWTWGDVGMYISGELGHWWIDDNGWLATGFTDPSYTY